MGFIMVLVSALARGLEIDCGCFRHEGYTSPGTALLRDLLLLIAAIFLFIRSAPVSKQPPLQR
jgi:hypothetical protein